MVAALAVVAEAGPVAAAVIQAAVAEVVRQQAPVEAAVDRVVATADRAGVAVVKVEAALARVRVMPA